MAICPPSERTALGCEVVDEADLKGHCGELWRDAFLRKGLVDIPMSSLEFTLEPSFSPGPTRSCTGVRLGTASPESGYVHKDFSVLSLDLVAARLCNRLIARGALKTGDRYTYRIMPSRKAVAPNTQSNVAPGAARLFTVVQKTAGSLPCLRVSLAPLLRASTVAGPQGAQFPVFYTCSAFEKAEMISRLGGRMDPPVETGAFLLGHLGSCPDSGELLAIVTDVTAFEDARQDCYALTPSARTWQGLQQRLRQEPSNGLPLLPLGQCHGHNFLPGSCESCNDRDRCPSSSAFVSRQDHIWSDATFEGSPYQLCHIFGRMATGGEVQVLHGLEDGRFQPREFHVVPDDVLAAQLEPGGQAKVRQG